MGRGGAMSTTYAFRDSAVATERLALVAGLFDGTTRAFIRDHATVGARLALDLGCGPGHTTRLLAEEARPDRTVGLDRSAAFVAQARDGGVEAIVHDVTLTPFPPGRADLIFCRFLLTHLADRTATLDRWTRELALGGRLLIEEVEVIETDDPVFSLYLSTVRELLGRRGGRLEVGTELERWGTSRIVTVEPDPDAVAQMFSLNLEAWRDELGAPLAGELAAGLRDPDRRPIAWHLRQVVHEAAR
jgi:ubiquinone/menaquinone biosynthesis C-methylase UbiE